METAGYRHNKSHITEDVDMYPLNEPRTVLMFFDGREDKQHTAMSKVALQQINHEIIFFFFQSNSDTSGRLQSYVLCHFNQF